MSKKLEGKIAVVTGASKGIGAAIAKRLAEDGAAVVVNYSSSKEDADKVVAEIVKKGGKAIAIRANLSEEAEIIQFFSEINKTFPHIDILVNNAGIYEFGPLEEITSEHFHKQFNLNVLGLLLATKEALKYFNKNGASVINIGSIAGQGVEPNCAAYSGTKGAVDAITKTLAKELGHRKIRVNAVNPGMVVTEGVIAGGFDKGEFKDQMLAKTPLGRIGQPSDIAPAVAFFASDDSSWISGDIMFIGGGII